LSTLYLVRHAQAGEPSDYDRLSPLGREQARLLGEFLSVRCSSCDGIWSGSLRRQRETAEEAAVLIRGKHPSLAPEGVDKRWDEFDLSAVYRFHVPRLIRDETGFARDYEERQREIRLDTHASRGATGRCDLAVIRSWMTGRYPGYAGESWSEFRLRVCEAVRALPPLESHHSQVVVTSAGPIAVAVATTLELPEERTLGLLGVLYNAGICSFRIRDAGLRLVSFNESGHLCGSRLRTFR